MDKHFFEFLLRMGDTTLILSQRLGEWTGHGPILEEDLALTNTALDLLGQARMWLTLAGEVEGAGRDEDALAYLRDAHQFHNALLVERANGNYADTMARQFLFDVWHYFLQKLGGPPTNASRRSLPRRSKSPITCAVRRTWWCAWATARPKATPRCRPPSTMPGASRASCSLTTPWTRTWPRAASAVCCPSCASPGPATWPRCWARPRCPCRTPQPRAIPPIAAAARTGTARNWATCWPRCNSCRAPIREQVVNAMAPVSASQVFDWLQEVPDPEIPVLSVVDLGVVRDVRWDGETCVVVITPTYSGCPAMREITQDIAATLARHGVDDARVDPPGAGLDHRLDERRAAPLKGYGIAAPAERAVDISGISRRRAAPAIECPRCGSRDTRLVSDFGSTSCKALYRCVACREPFDYFKTH